MNINKVKLAVSKVAGRSGLILKKNSPEILMGAGVIAIVAGTVLACRATLKVEEVLDTAKMNFDKIKEAKTLVEAGEPIDYSASDYRKDMTIAYVKTGANLVKLYGPAVTVSTLGIACVLSAHGIMRQRNLGLIAAYKAIEESFAAYRRRVVEEYGAEKDHEFKVGYRKELEVVIGTDENGKKIKTKETHNVLDPRTTSQYARFFDESSSIWERNPEYNLMTLRAQQNYANDLLKIQGHVFLNEVYDMLGIPRSRAGAMVGWVKDNGDNFVDFGIFDGKKHMVRDFVNGYEASILLDFNVDGVIYDLI